MPINVALMKIADRIGDPLVRLEVKHGFTGK